MSPRERTLSTSAPRLPLRRRLGFALIATAIAYLAAEIAATVAFHATVPSVYWLYDGHAPMTEFDPRTGYRVVGEPTRIAKYTRSQNPRQATLEYVGAVVGNAQGFPDRSDFAPERTLGSALRCVVFGDSFTGGDLPLNWPDRCEDVSAERGRDLDLLNFSHSGFGLANWHRVLTEVIVPERYDIDAIVFAVWDNDLARRFYVCEQGEGGTQLGGRARSWETSDYPKDRFEALALMSSWDGRVVTHEQFERALRGEWTPTRAWEPFIAGTLLSHMRSAPPTPVGAVPPGELRGDLTRGSSGRGRLVREIEAAARTLGVPILVVKIPTRDELLAAAPSSDVLRRDDDARAFAEFLDAPYVDGSVAFAGLSDDQVRAQWYPQDPHWNQAGSDRFAAWMARMLGEWAPRRRVAERDGGVGVSGDASLAR